MFSSSLQESHLLSDHTSQGSSAELALPRLLFPPGHKAGPPSLPDSEEKAQRRRNADVHEAAQRAETLVGKGMLQTAPPPDKHLCNPLQLPTIPAMPPVTCLGCRHHMPCIPPPFVQRGRGGGGRLCHPGAVSAPIQSFHATLTQLSGPVDPAHLGKDGPGACLLHAPPHNSNCPPSASPDGLLFSSSPGLRHHGK